MAPAQMWLDRRSTYRGRDSNVAQEGFVRNPRCGRDARPILADDKNVKCQMSNVKCQRAEWITTHFTLNVAPRGPSETSPSEVSMEIWSDANYYLFARTASQCVSVPMPGLHRRMHPTLLRPRARQVLFRPCLGLAV
ncbi:uncharacterized protein N7459_001178 [Penicillium hispanicum]|uniref:uncharacterized protein n=1 Tax=Penicillium hispanicum TaxID=1080232 RepID=UPI002540427D|nr:uncharacterized protein N7459_001178 [Penicillium hispanicum]KAJ5594970.1 hypothetical protein N7459_001178 [Penicillium hispanicum]